MTARRVMLLFGIGIVVIASAVWMSSRSETGQDSIAGTRVLPGLESSVNDVTEIRITKADRTQTTQDASERLVSRLSPATYANGTPRAKRARSKARM